ncbi:MAG: hypothetical protein K2Z80_34935 [Xanthobacteraceae bacterium]|nr:hypothetical protein [Xanthobacteraceae bacterium]
MALLLVPAAASAADVVWTVSNMKGRAFLGGMPDVPEVDYELWAHCRPDGNIEVGAGAEAHVGKARGEAVTLKLTSAATTATLTGVSRRSENSEMTGGIELRAVVSREHPLFAVLATGKPISVSGPIKPMTWPAKGLKARTAEFLKACK